MEIASNTPVTSTSDKTLSRHATNIFNDLPECAPLTATAAIGDELKNYLNSKIEDALDPLKWWHQRRGEYPRLSRMALNYLSIPGACTQLPSESMVLRTLKESGKHRHLRNQCPADELSGLPGPSALRPGHVQFPNVLNVFLNPLGVQVSLTALVPDAEIDVTRTLLSSSHNAIPPLTSPLILQADLSLLSFTTFHTKLHVAFALSALQGI
ncbi:hypothetical protein D9613_012726 [Agrocybe pediades]|uniref:HAT C-terminal dimerisation domain-containing protein n=1 Tax=Agrocybe pediades TaxID=84607 RepID=A0A8H4QKI8_9AGAR|nr:hypothetical protein D9613_012726 [Agrocybe pediades]